MTALECFGCPVAWLSFCESCLDCQKYQICFHGLLAQSMPAQLYDPTRKEIALHVLESGNVIVISRPKALQRRICK